MLGAYAACSKRRGVEEFENMSRPITPPEVRFHNSYMPEPNTGCWLWLGATRRRGYGNFKVDAKTWVAAHRYSWTLHKFDVPDGLWVLHKCDTPACINPEHLFIGSRRENVDDMLAKGRHRYVAARGANHYRARRKLASLPKAPGDG